MCLYYWIQIWISLQLHPAPSSSSPPLLSCLWHSSRAIYWLDKLWYTLEVIWGQIGVHLLCALLLVSNSEYVLNSFLREHAIIINWLILFYNTTNVTTNNYQPYLNYCMKITFQFLSFFPIKLLLPFYGSIIDEYLIYWNMK